MKHKPLTKDELQKHMIRNYKKRYPHINNKTITDFIKERFPNE